MGSIQFDGDSPSQGTVEAPALTQRRYEPAEQITEG